MGSSLSLSSNDETSKYLEGPAAELSDRIDKEIREDAAAMRARRQQGVLLLGSGQSGKTTLIKQMKVSHREGLSAVEFAEYRPVVYENLLDSARQVVLYMRKTGIRCSCDPSGVLARKILDSQLDAKISYEMAEAIHQLWNDPNLVKVLDGRSSGLYLTDSAKYFLDGALRIGSPNYLPNEQDVMKAQQKNAANGIVETQFQNGKTTISIFDVRGQRAEQRKWIHHFDFVTSILFVAALDEYAQGILEDDTTVENRLADTLEYFDLVVNSLWFRHTSIILMLTKMDLFALTLSKVPLEIYFPNYTGGPDVDKAQDYILSKFREKNQAGLTIYPHRTQAADPLNVKVIFSAVADTKSQNYLKSIHLL